MPQCQHYDICGRDVEGNPAEGLCILHSTDSTKDAHAFADALATHREHKGDNFVHFLFPERANFAGASFREADFSGARFCGDALFVRARFSGSANFARARFCGSVLFAGARFSWVNFADAAFSNATDFGQARFSGDALFVRARFSGSVDFGGFRTSSATFSKDANFREARFCGDALFVWARFSEMALFVRARFCGIANFTGASFREADFSGARFSGDALFVRATFSGRTRFAGRLGLGRAEAAGHIFAGTKVDFRQVVIDPPDIVTFVEADLTTCQFQDTDLRKVQIVGEKWPQVYWHKISKRTVVYDECLLWKEKKNRSTATRPLPWSQLERLYRELKQNYEDRRDYERAGDFHYGEKEMRRQNPDTAWGLYFFLTLYWLFSGYGERYLRPLLWAGLLLVGSTTGYMWWGLRPKANGSSLTWTNGWDWLQATYYSFRVMTFLKPDDWVLVGYAHILNTFQTLLAPIFLGLFALALRQRLKR